METDHILQEIRVDAIMTAIGLETTSAKDTFKAQFNLKPTNPEYLNARTAALMRLRQAPPEWLAHVEALKVNEVVLREIDPAKASESQMEDWSQILFKGQFSGLNFVPFALMYVAFSKIILAPMFAWSMPFMTIILPYFALRFVYGLPIEWSQYWDSMKPMIFGASNKPWGVSSVLQWGSMAVSYAHGMYIPYTNAKHCYNIDQLMLRGSRAVTDSLTRLKAIQDLWVAGGLKKMWSLPAREGLGDERQVVAWLVEDPTLLPQLYKAIGTVEILSALLANEHLRPVEWVQSATPYCKMISAVDCLIQPSKRVPFNLIMGEGNHHGVVTGPNRGGKSTFLRSALTNIMLAQAWGVAFARRCVMTPVEWVISSLRLEDRPGEMSLFEREVAVAGEILRRVRLQGTRGWVVIDELFHTTNPPDAETASQIFLRQLWRSETTSSLVSTHLFKHAETAPDGVQRLCVASEMQEGSEKVIYQYEVTEGINTMSSVNELLTESGVIPAGGLSADILDGKSLTIDLEEDPNAQ